MKFSVHNAQTAPEKSAPTLAGAKQNYGFVPNLLGVMAESPALLKAYTTLSGVFDETSFSPTERQVILLSVSRDNGCGYCMAAHSVIAGMQGAPQDVVNAIRNGTDIADSKLEALRRFTASVVSTRGWPEETALKEFLEAGYSEANLLEVIVGIGMKTLSNYTNHIAQTPLDEQFKPLEWRVPKQSA